MNCGTCIVLMVWTVTIGSNNQTTPLLFDTGSYVTWVNPDCSKVKDPRSRRREECFRQPRYDPFTSKTAKIQSKPLNETYGIGGALGSYFTDDFKVGSITANNALFGVAAVSFELEAGIWGGRRRTAKMDPTITETFAAQGRINSHVFSVDLRLHNESSEQKPLSCIVYSLTVIQQAHSSSVASTQKSTRA